MFSCCEAVNSTVDEVNAQAAASGSLRILAARYGWAPDLWGEATHADPFKNGWKDVTDTVQRMVSSEELHMNPSRAPQWMNQHLWPESARGPQIPRKIGVRFQYGGGAVQQLEPAAVPHEAFAVHITPSS